MLSETSEKRAKMCIMSGTLELFLGSSFMERLIRYNLARHHFQISVIICAKTDIIFPYKNSQHGIIAVGIQLVHLFIEFRHVHTYMKIDVVSGRMTETRRQRLQLLPMKKPHRSIASGYVPEASRVVLCNFGQIDMICTLVQALYFEVGTYE